MEREKEAMIGELTKARDALLRQIEILITGRVIGSSRSLVTKLRAQLREVKKALEREKASDA
jgi:hypothetical protein